MKVVLRKKISRMLVFSDCFGPHNDYAMQTFIMYQFNTINCGCRDKNTTSALGIAAESPQ